MQRAYAKVSAEMPNVKRVQVSPRQSSLMTSLFMPKGAYAVTNPFTGNITYNPEMFEGQTQDDIEQTLYHELTHAGQMQNTPWYGHLKEVGSQMLDNVSTLWGGNEDKVPAGISASSPLNSPYYWRPREMEAFQAERDRATRNKIPNYVDPVLGTRDIPLFPDRKKSGINVAPSSMRQ